jgi:hypothetical protein
LKGQIKEKDFSILKNYAVPKLSSYGVLALDCKDDVSATLAWISRALVSRFEGAVVPLCYPDTHFGPDVVFFMHTDNYKDNRFVASQIKLKNQVNEAAALRTVVPELFYHNNRDVASKMVPYSMSPEDAATWSTLKASLFESDREPCKLGLQTRSKKISSPTATKKRKREIIRFIIQYPANKTASATQGPVAFAEYKSCGDKRICKQHDLLVTIDGNNVHELFDAEGVGILKLVKDQVSKNRATES